MVKKTEAVDSTTSTTRRGTRRARPIRASLGLVRRGEHEGAARLCADDDHRCWLGLWLWLGLGLGLGLVMEGRRQMDAQRDGAAGKSTDGRHCCCKRAACKNVGE